MIGFDIHTLPKFCFAHIYETPSYHNIFIPDKQIIEITYIEQGSIRLTTARESFVAEQGDIIALMRNKEITIDADSFHRHHTIAAITDYKTTEDTTNSLILPFVTKNSAETKPIHQMIDEFIYKQNNFKTSHNHFAAKFLQLLCSIDHCARNSLSHSLPSEQIYAKKAKNFIQENIYRPITQKEVAQHLEISTGYLCNIFKKAEGISLIKYINKTKLDGLKMLMDRENIHLYEAAALYGYSDPNYVSRLYKQLYGYNITDKPIIHR